MKRSLGACRCCSWKRCGVSGQDITARAINEEKVGAWAMKSDLDLLCPDLRETSPILSPDRFVLSLHKYETSLDHPLLTLPVLTFSAFEPLPRIESAGEKKGEEGAREREREARETYRRSPHSPSRNGRRSSYHPPGGSLGAVRHVHGGAVVAHRRRPSLSDH